MNGATRTESLEAFNATSSEDPLDLLVVGGGVVGAAAAFDAATRGLKVGLVEAHDVAQGTSSRSSKLVHGGLRYLQMLDFKLVAEALRERNLLLNWTAPHLVRGLNFVFPLQKRITDRVFIGAGIALYDALSLLSTVVQGRKSPQGKRVPLHRHLTRKALRKRFPGLDSKKFVGGLEYFDAQVDDARLVLMLARSAHSLGAHVATQTKVLRYLKGGDGRDGDRSSTEAVVGAVLEDQETGRSLEVFARETLLAAGVWTGGAQGDSDSPSRLSVLASKGAHITVPKSRIRTQGHVGLITQTASSVLFIIPMDRYWIIGTTDTPWGLPVDLPTPTAKDIDYILACANEVLDQHLTVDDVVGSWAGLRPLLQRMNQSPEASAKVSREHAVSRLEPGLSVVAGGKLTTFRSMAQDAVSFVTAAAHPQRQSLTAQLPVLGGSGYDEWVQRGPEVQQRYGFAANAVDRLLNRYGSLIEELLRLIDQRPDLAGEVTGGGGYLRAEFVYAVRCEGALHLADLVERRTRLVHEVPDRGVAALGEIAELVADELGWDEADKAREVQLFEKYIEGHLKAEKAVSDEEAIEILRACRAAT